MELGIHLIDFSQLGGPARIAQGVSDVASAAEDAGCQHFSVMDHYLQMDRVFDRRHPMLEAYATLAFVAGRTERLKLHVLVTGVSYRHPGLLAKIVATLDVLSGGRAELGIGAAWYEPNTGLSACRSRRWRSGSSGSRRRCRSAGRCGARTRARSRQALPARRDDLLAAAAVRRAAADRDRRWR